MPETNKTQLKSKSYSNKLKNITGTKKAYNVKIKQSNGNIFTSRVLAMGTIANKPDCT